MDEKITANTMGKEETSKDSSIVSMKGISKHFGGVQALKDVDLDLYPNEILGLVGDNAAGKSTLMKILAGVLQPDSGEIFLEGKLISSKSPQEARDHGIEMVYQDFALVRGMWVAGNIFMGREPTRGFIGKWLGILDKPKMVRMSQKILEEQNVSIGSCLKAAGALSGGQQQSVAIARALGFNAKVVIMDEPTASLGVKQATRLLELTKELPKRGISVVYISHRMQDVFYLSDRVMVLKTGEKVADVKKEETNVDEIVKLMILGKQNNSVKDDIANISKRERLEDKQ
jgi:simple sugar transport system ATP-binding protein